MRKGDITVKYLISELCAGCCPANVEIGAPDKDMTERVKARVLENLGMQEKSRGTRKTARIVLLAAAAAALLGTAAFAASDFFMKQESADGVVSGHWTEYAKDGSLLSDQELFFPEAGMVFTFTGPETAYNEPEVRVFWVPSEPNSGRTDEEGWTTYLADWGADATDENIPWIISVQSVKTDGSKYVLNGTPTVVKEEYWGELYVQEIHSDYSDGKKVLYDEANYILLFDESRGYLVIISGTSDMETLEHIAQGLEIRESDSPKRENNLAADIGAIDVGRG